MKVKHFYFQTLLYLLAFAILAIIFTTYFAPEMMVAITNQVWALCGW
ncbi:MAG: hypothetical protein RL517_978 [Pseudomonadota bacterium]|jgi:hypothetical protein